MKKSLLGLLLMLTSFSAWAVPITVSIETPKTDVIVGEMFSIDIFADITDPILGWGLDINYDNNIIEQSGAAVIASTWLPGFSLDSDNLAGLAFPFPVVGADILLATINFEATIAGSTAIDAGTSLFDFTEGFALLAPNSFAEVNYIGTMITVSDSITAVPEPSSILLFAVSLIALRFRLLRS